VLVVVVAVVLVAVVVVVILIVVPVVVVVVVVDVASKDDCLRRCQKMIASVDVILLHRQKACPPSGKDVPIFVMGGKHK
jgi:hypothetical protein